MVQAIGHVLLWILAIILGIVVLGCLGFWAIFGDAAIWIVRIVLIVLIAKFVWKIIWK